MIVMIKQIMIVLSILTDKLNLKIYKVEHQYLLIFKHISKSIKIKSQRNKNKYGTCKMKQPIDKNYGKQKDKDYSKNIILNWKKF